jgi:hypothetical protein
MIVMLHVATGALAGAASGSRLRAFLLGPPLHAICDAVPHEDIPSPGFETASGFMALLTLAAARGPLDPATVGAAAASAPDLEHVLRHARRGTRAIFPSHRYRHRPGGLPAWAQLLIAAGILRLLTRGASRSKRRLRSGH